HRPREGAEGLEVLDGLPPSAPPVLSEAQELSDRGRRRSLVGEGAQDLAGLLVALALVGPGGVGQAVGDRGGAAAAPGGVGQVGGDVAGKLPRRTPVLVLGGCR